MFYPVGTGFFVGIEITGKEVDYDNIPNHYFAINVVTALHVLKNEEGNYFDEIFIRLNNNTIRYLRIYLTTTISFIYLHPSLFFQHNLLSFI